MSNPIKVSVLVAAFNAEKYIVQTIKSVQAQDYPGWELIIVDDGSVDRTASLVEHESCLDPRIKLFRQTNQGAHIARNVAFENCSGDYLVILDADDCILPGKFSLEVLLLDNFPQCGVVYGDTWHCDSDMNRVELESEKYPSNHVDGDVFSKIICGNLFAVHAAMVRRKCIDEVGLHDRDPGLIADWDLWVRVAEVYSFYYHGKPVAEYRLHPLMSAKMDPSVKQCTQRRGVASRIERLKRFALLSSFEKSMFYVYNGRFAHRFGQWQLASAWYFKAIRNSLFNWKAYVLFGLMLIDAIRLKCSREIKPS